MTIQKKEIENKSIRFIATDTTEYYSVPDIRKVLGKDRILLNKSIPDTEKLWFVPEGKKIKMLFISKNYLFQYLKNTARENTYKTYQNLENRLM